MSLLSKFEAEAIHKTPPSPISVPAAFLKAVNYRLSRCETPPQRADLLAGYCKALLSKRQLPQALLLPVASLQKLLLQLGAIL